MSHRYDPRALEAFAVSVLQNAGLTPEAARAVATGLLTADLYGHTTHGLALLPEYLEELAAGTMAKDDRPEVLNATGAVEVWDARRLPGVWTTALAVERAAALASTLGIGAIALRRSHHIACLAAFLEAPARAGKVILVLSSDPSDAHVAPFGGVRPVITPNPIAIGIPNDPEPILIDISMSITTAGLSARARAEGTQMPGDWLLTAGGEPTSDPHALKQGGSLLPVGGLDHGHKGFALGLMVDVLTQGLSGFGRADAPKDWGAAVLVLAMDPAAFAGSEAFVRQVRWTADAARASPARPGSTSVRLPGDQAIARRREAEANGLRIHPSVEASLRKLAQTTGTALPTRT